MPEDLPLEECVSKVKTRYDLIVIASSAGGIEPLLQILSGFPHDFPAAIIAVQHLHPDHKSYLSAIAARRTALKVKQAEDRDTICPGWVYIAPPDYHLVVTEGARLALSHAERKNYVRPSADLLFESAAQVYKERLIAVILSGSGKDGKEGMVVVKQMGGFNIVQDRSTAAYFEMPQAAISTGKVDLILPVEEITGRVLSMVRTGVVE
jgi:two-component system, chemotaxis family, protein-glutamate methylesterase/glutaminase